MDNIKKQEQTEYLLHSIARIDLEISSLNRKLSELKTQREVLIDMLLELNPDAE